MSDGVPDDVMITSLVRKVSLKASPEEWADAIITHIRNHHERVQETEKLVYAGYDIQQEAKKMSEFYEQIGNIENKERI